MDRLSTNMASITEFSGKISDTLQDRRQQIQKLSGGHTLLKKVTKQLQLQAHSISICRVFVSAAILV